MSNCTLCLANLDNLIKHSVGNTVLWEIFERITNTKLHTKCGSSMLCYICLAILQRCHSFYKMSRRAEETFDYLISNNIEVSPQQITKLNLGLQSLTIIPTDHLSITCSKLDVKEEIVDDVTPAIDDMIEPYTVCRTCLVRQTKMQCVEFKGFKNIFEKLTNLKLNTEGRPTKVCYICLSHLKKCTQIIKKSSTAEIIAKNKTAVIFCKLGTNTLSPEIAHNLSTSTSIFSTSNTHTHVPVKIEIKEETEIDKTKKALRRIKPVYECQICNKILISMRNLEKHIKKHTSTCCYYDGKFSTKSSTKSNTKSSSKSSLTRHEKLHSCEIYICDYCKKEFKRKEPLLRHIRLHTGLKPHACEVCDKRFSYIGNYNQHIKTHTDVKPFSCKRCSKSFYDRSTLNLHFSDHVKQVFICDYCSKTYHRKYQLERHFKIHTNDRPYACKSCDKAFYDKPNLIIHIRRHTGEKPFKCYKCNKTFADESAMQRHLRTHEEKTFICNICNLKVSTQFILQSHMRKHTGIKPYRCITCYKSYFSNKDLQRHIKTHSIIKSFACAKCNKSFKGQAKLKTHMMFEHAEEDPNTCNICNKKFTRRRNLMAHMNVHSSVKSYACDECGKKFKHQCNFSRHKKLHKNKTMK